MSLNEIEEDGNDDGDFTNTVDKELIDSIINEPLLFDNLDTEKDVNDFDDIKHICVNIMLNTWIRMIVLRINLSTNSLNVFA